MRLFFIGLLLVCAILLILLALLQSGKSDGISGAFTGGDGLNLFANVKERGSEKVITQITAILGLVFILTAIALQIIK